ncbi:MAG: carboxymuconolactone decarboxylase family protein [Solirubrobacteraceae bacterium]
MKKPTGCEYCVDLGSQICRNSGFCDEELLALPRYRSSDLFTEREKLALDYTAAVMRTPVEVTDELFARMKEHFTDARLRPAAPPTPARCRRRARSSRGRCQG